MLDLIARFSLLTPTRLELLERVEGHIGDKLALSGEQEGQHAQLEMAELAHLKNFNVRCMNVCRDEALRW